MNAPKRIKRKLDGVLILDKPVGFSSNQALQKVRFLVQAEKGGHTGTLDPFATGVLPLCFGEATKFAQRLLEANKTYWATVQLGQTTTTGDIEGEVLAQQPVDVSDAALETVFAQFRGTIQQTPPMYSALKFEGKPLYEYARAGITLERPARTVTIHRLTLLNRTETTLTLEVECSKGTYIRSLAEDIGSALGCGAHLTALRRTATAGFSIDQSHALAQIEAASLDERDALLLPADALVAELPALTLDAEQTRKMLQGQTLCLPEAHATIGEMRLYDESHRFLGVGMLTSPHLLMPGRLISTC